ncbi:hypothetical protein PoB_003692100 [Plakobranchus ocellatus]|uniref:Uncharacterized protein n=1 Tax=Plakobranchus ocellatus TaxID=259542 RepID=A0AAV4AQI1_9GAST|nr:hypothetical protein PoB_003692100 [Plakobranchus ocellatus]
MIEIIKKDKHFWVTAISCTRNSALTASFSREEKNKNDFKVKHRIKMKYKHTLSMHFLRRIAIEEFSLSQDFYRHVISGKLKKRRIEPRRHSHCRFHGDFTKSPNHQAPPFPQYQPLR